jgi:hypothetical protein
MSQSTGDVCRQEMNCIVNLQNRNRTFLDLILILAWYWDLSSNSGRKLQDAIAMVWYLL